MYFLYLTLKKFHRSFGIQLNNIYRLVILQGSLNSIVSVQNISQPAPRVVAVGNGLVKAGAAVGAMQAFHPQLDRFVVIILCNQRLCTGDRQ